MKKKTTTAPPKKSVNTKTKDAGAHGSRERPKGDERGAKWPGGGKKGEDE